MTIPNRFRRLGRSAGAAVVVAAVAGGTALALPSDAPSEVEVQTDDDTAEDDSASDDSTSDDSTSDDTAPAQSTSDDSEVAPSDTTTNPAVTSDDTSDDSIDDSVDTDADDSIDSDEDDSMDTMDSDDGVESEEIAVVDASQFGERELSAGDGGTVTYVVDADGFRLVSVEAADGWTAEVEQESGDEIDLDLRSDGVRIQVDVEFEDGQVRERVRVRND